MSWQMTALVKANFIGPPALKLLAMSIADYADRDGAGIYPSVATLAKHCCIGHRSCERYMAKLREMGFLEVVRAAKGGTVVTKSGIRQGRTVHYRIASSWLQANPASLAEQRAVAPPTRPLAPPREPVHPATAVADKYSNEDSTLVARTKSGLEGIDETEAVRQKLKQQADELRKRPRSRSGS